MTKLEFMKELESLLSDIPLEEREEAIQYYNDYFEDAGADHEEEVIKELVSPSKVASIIKADLNSNIAERESRGYFTENGYQDTMVRDEKYELVGTENRAHNDEKNTKSDGERTASTHANGNANDTRNQQYHNANHNGNQQYQNTNRNNYQQYQNANRNGNQQYSNANRSGNQQANGSANYSGSQQTKKNTNTGLVVLIAILGFPIWFPIAISALGVAFGVVAAILGIVFGLGAAGIAMVGIGIALFVAGILQFTVPLIAMLMIGTGLVIFGIGMLLVLAAAMICKYLIPPIIRGIVELCRLPFKNRRVMA
jgi:uncharacterized membrane protein